MKRCLLTGFAVLLCGLTMAQQLGEVYSTIYQPMGVPVKVNTGLVTQDSGIVIGGAFERVHERAINRLAKLKQDGTNDYSFDIGSGFNGEVNVVVEQPNGRLIVGGDFTQYNGSSCNRIVRLMSDGSRDTSFSIGTGFNGSVYDIELLTGGELVVVGTFTTYNGSTRQRVAKLNSNGSLYSSFSVSVNNTIFCIARDTSGRLVIGGSFTTVSGVSCTRIARLKSSGVLDTAYSTATSGANNTVNEVALQPGGEAIFAGYFTQFNGSTVNRIVRLSSTGTVDGTYSSGSGFGGAQVNEMVWQSDGKLLVIGHFTSYDGTTLGRVVRLDSNGTRDTTFTAGTGLDYSSNAIWLNYDGSVFVGGTFTTVNGFGRLGLAKLSSSGSLDKGFMKNSGADGPVLAFGTQSSGKTIVAGDFVRYNGDTVNRIMRLNRDGSLDSGFGSGTGANGVINAVLVQPDDKIVIAGSFTTYNGVSKNRIARLHSDGSIDSTYQSGSGANAAINEAKWASSGKLYIAGSFTSYNGTTRNRVCRLNSNGSLDAGFNAGTTFSAAVHDIVEQPDGKVIGGGGTVSGGCGGTPCSLLRRVDSTGAADNTFDAGTTTSSTTIQALQLQPDGKLLVNCYTSFNGIAASRMARLNTNGSVDTSFAGSANFHVQEFLKVDSMYLVAGAFTQVNSTSKMYVSSLKTDGQTDATFYTGDGMGYVYYLAGYCKRLYADEVNGRIWAGGVFSTAQGGVNNNMAVFRGTYGSAAAIDSVKMPSVVCPGSSLYARFKNTRYFNEGNVFTAELSDSSGSFASAQVIGHKTATGAPGWDSLWVSIADTVLPGSHYRIRIKTSNAIYVSVAGAEFAVGVRDATVAGGIITSSKDTVCPNKKVSLYLSGYSGSIQWEKKGTANEWIRISGATNDTLHIDSFSVTTSYRVIVTKDYCSSDTSNIKTIYQNTSFDCIYEYNWYYLMVHTIDTNNIPIHPDSLRSRNSALNAILNEVQVTQFYKPFPNAKTAYLNDVYAIHCNGDVDTLYQRILEGEFFDYVEPTPHFVQTICNSPISVDDPEPSGGNWALEMIDAECAWSVTKGSSDVIVGLVDGEFQETHEDLIGKFNSITGSNSFDNPLPHGTSVSSCIAARTNNGLGIASIGYDIRMNGYIVETFVYPWGVSSIVGWPGIWSAYLNGDKIITISASELGCPNAVVCTSFLSQTIVRAAVKEILNSGSLLVFSAANKELEDISHVLEYQDDPGVIIVGGVSPISGDYWHGVTGSAHNKYIDLCGPFSSIRTAMPSASSNSEYGNNSGNSFATPMVAGTAALLLAINPSLKNYEIENILKCSTNPIADAAIYINSNGESLIGTGRLNAYQACLLAQKSVTMQEVASNSTWNSEKILWDVTVKNGATLTISSGSVIEMGANTKITVEPGAKLIVDNATITNSCAGMWGGITVEGNPNQSQQAISGSGSSGTYHQGAVFLNNATIENAEVAVNLSAAETAKRGGIIQATGSTFANNRYDVVMPAYRWQNANNASHFFDCTFSTTAALPSADPNPRTHVLLFGVRGIGFNGCKFENTRNGLTYDYELGNGIMATDASFRVDDFCAAHSGSTCTDLRESRFANLRHGISIGRFVNPQACRVEHTEFDHCLRAIRNEGVNFANFSGNTIAVGNTATITDITDFNKALLDEGIILRQCTGFTVEGNAISPATDGGSPTVELTIGIRADGTGGNYNAILNNEYNQLAYANLANRQNRTVTFPNIGLEYLCNQQADNGFDICVTAPIWNDPSWAATGVQGDQGRNTRAAGNKFSNTIISEGNFFNQSGNLNDYYFDDNATGEEPINFSNSVNPKPTAAQGGCPSTTDNGGNNFNHFLATATTGVLSSQYSSNNALLQTEKAALATLTDGGNTTAMLAYLNTHNSAADSTAVLDTLLALSPWLSVALLESASQKETSIPNYSMLQVLLANPDALQTQALVEHLQRRNPAMPQVWIDSVLANKDTLTARTYLEDSIVRHTAARNAAAYEMLSRIALNEDSTDYTALRNWLDSLQSPAASMYKALTYMETDAPDTALAKLRAISSSFVLSREDSLQLNSVDTLLSFYVSWYNTQSDTNLRAGDFSNIDSVTLAALDSFASQQNEFLNGTQMARNFMNVYNKNYFTEAQLPDAEPEARRAQPESEPQIEKEEALQIKVYPNPTKDYFVIENNCDTAELNIAVYDVYGNVVAERREEKFKQLTIDTKGWASGIYLWSVVAKGKKGERGKISVVRW